MANAGAVPSVRERTFRAALVRSREQLAHQVAASAAAGNLVVLTGASGAGKTVLLDRVAELYEGSVVVGGGLSGLRTVPNLALSRALRLPIPFTDATRVAEYVLAAAGRSTLLVLDDAQLCDRTTLEAVALLAGNLPMVLAISDDSGPGAALVAALATLASATRQTLAALADDEALQIVSAAAPGKRAGDLRAVVRAAHGNPRTLVAMAHDPHAHDLRVAVANRLAGLGPESRTALCLLGLLARPADMALLGEHLARAALDSGVVVAADGWLTPRSKLDADVAVAVLTDQDRRTMHAQLARRLVDPGEQARHFAAAGERVRALKCAERAAEAATSAIEGISHRALAARMLDEPARTEACLTVAVAASDCGDHHLALTLVAEATVHPDRRVGLVRARAALTAGDAASALAELDSSVGSACPEADDSLAFARSIDRARALCLLDPIQALGVAGEAFTAAATPADRARAGGVLGAAQLAAGTDGWQSTLRTAQADAEESGLYDVAFAAAANLCSGLLRSAEPDEAYSLAMSSRTAAMQTGAGSWAVRFEAIGLWVVVQVRAALSEGRRAGEMLLDGALPAALRGEVAAQVALACADGGDFAAAAAYLSSSNATDDLLSWCEAEVDLLSGNSRQAEAKATALLGQPSRWPVPAFATLTAAWAGSAGRVVNPHIVGGGSGGASAELAALAVRDSDPPRAAELFGEAAIRWTAFSRRSELRCRLAAAVARAHSDRAGALEQLRQIAADVACGELQILAGQLIRARRQLGDPELSHTSSGPRGATLSRREAEVMAAVAEGATSAAIAGRLGVAPSTVETHVKSAMRKLGANTRTEAAVRALTA